MLLAVIYMAAAKTPIINNEPWILWIVSIIIAIIGVSSSFYFYGKYKALIKNPNLEAQKETSARQETWFFTNA